MEVQYVGGDVGMSYIERDKLSLPEIRGHLGDHTTVNDETQLHWLFPEKGLRDGLRLLYDDKWPISDNPRPHPPSYVKMPGRPKKKDRRREPTEKPKGPKLSKVGTKMACSICRRTDHNSRTCRQNREADKKKNAHIKRVATKKRKHDEMSNSAPNFMGDGGTQQNSTAHVGTTVRKAAPRNTSRVTKLLLG